MVCLAKPTTDGWNNMNDLKDLVAQIYEDNTPSYKTYTLADAIEKKAKELKAGVCDPVIATVLEEGEERGNNTRLIADGVEVTVINKVSKTVSPSDLGALLEELGIPEEKVMIEKVTVVPSPSKLQDLVDWGEIPQERLDALYKKTIAVKAKLLTE